MAHLNGENPRLQLDPDASELFLQLLRAELQKGSVCAVTVGLECVDRVDPVALRLLHTAADEARRTGKALYVDGAGPVVYKALQLAKLGPFFRRLHRAASAS